MSQENHQQNLGIIFSAGQWSEQSGKLHMKVDNIDATPFNALNTAFQQESINVSLVNNAKSELTAIISNSQDIESLKKLAAEVCTDKDNEYNATAKHNAGGIIMTDVQLAPNDPEVAADAPSNISSPSPDTHDQHTADLLTIFSHGRWQQKTPQSAIRVAMDLKEFAPLQEALKRNNIPTKTANSPTLGYCALLPEYSTDRLKTLAEEMIAQAGEWQEATAAGQPITRVAIAELSTQETTALRNALSTLDIEHYQAHSSSMGETIRVAGQENVDRLKGMVAQHAQAAPQSPPNPSTVAQPSEAQHQRGISSHGEFKEKEGRY